MTCFQSRRVYSFPDKLHDHFYYKKKEEEEEEK
jgi:hypothetical protein